MSADIEIRKWIEWEGEGNEWFGISVGDFYHTSSRPPSLWRKSAIEKPYVVYRKLSSVENELARILFIERGVLGLFS